jgi:hypothetical protein
MQAQDDELPGFLFARDARRFNFEELDIAPQSSGAENTKHKESGSLLAAGHCYGAGNKPHANQAPMVAERERHALTASRRNIARDWLVTV